MVGFDYIVEKYSNAEQKERYGKRAFKGLHVAEKVLVDKYFCDGTTLDVGTGCGRFAIGAYKMGYTDMYGIDINDDWINYAKDITLHHGYNIKFSTQNATSTNFKSNTFNNTFFTSDGFAQTPGAMNRLKILKEMLRISKEDGIFIFTTPDEHYIKMLWPDYWKELKEFRERNLWRDKDFYDENDMEIYDGGYINYTPIDETKRIVRESGFTLLEHKSALELTGGFLDPKSSNVSHYFVLCKRKSI